MLIEIEDLWKIYRNGELEVLALEDVNLSIQEGEFLSIMGPSGSGKSTLMNIIGCLDRSTQGRFLIKGQDTSHMNEKELARLRNREIGFIFQTFNLLSRTNALNNVALPLIYSGVKRRERERRGRALLGEVGLGDRMHHLPSQLSGGQKQRVAIARALINEPGVILADEPTGNLDTRSGEEIMKILGELNRKGHTIIMVTHDHEISAHAHRSIILRDGKIEKEERN